MFCCKRLRLGRLRKVFMNCQVKDMSMGKSLLRINLALDKVNTKS